MHVAKPKSYISLCLSWRIAATILRALMVFYYSRFVYLVFPPPSQVIIIFIFLVYLAIDQLAASRRLVQTHSHPIFLAGLSPRRFRGSKLLCQGFRVWTLLAVAPWLKFFHYHDCQVKVVYYSPSICFIETPVFS